jgi:hypothetical protein
MAISKHSSCSTINRTNHTSALSVAVSCLGKFLVVLVSVTFPA